MMKIENLSKRYGREKSLGIEDVSFSVNNAEIVGFVGLNGAGKTTTIRVACGVALPSSGTVEIEGHDVVVEKQKASEQIGWVPEFPSFDQNARAKNLLLYFAGYRHISRDIAEKRARDLFQQLELSGQENKKLRDYSQGMKKRFSLALSLLPDPNNFLFDEVLNGLDPQGIQFLRSLLTDLKKQGKSILLSSHILSEVETISDRIVFIHRGRVIKIVTRSELRTIEESTSTLRMTIPNINDEGLYYLRTLGAVAVEDGIQIVLSDFHVDPSIISTELVKRGFLIRQFSIDKSSLEEYFFTLVGERRAA